MYELERIAVVIKPTQLFLDWLKRVPDSAENAEIELRDLREDCTTLLIPSFDSPEEADEYIEQIYEELFTNELDGWHEDTAVWPKKRDYYTFKAWFDLEYHSMVYDLVDESDDEGDDDYEEDFEDEDEETFDDDYDSDDDNDAPEEEWFEDEFDEDSKD